MDENVNGDKSREVPSPISKNNDKEYEILRAEILQYLEEYQTVRNMMYIVTATILGINSAIWNNYYLFILPLIVILPSYLIFYNYWQTVTCASTYLQVFLEGNVSDEKQRTNSFYWESRHAELEKTLIEKKKNNNNLIKKNLSKITSLGMRYHQIPYWVCGCLCIILFFIKATVQGNSFHFIFTWPFLKKDLALGFLVIVVSLSVFFIFGNVDRADYIDAWKEIKENEVKIHVKNCGKTSLPKGH